MSRESQNPLAAELFVITDECLGSAWVDDCSEKTNAEVLEDAERAAYWALVAANRIRGFIQRRRSELDAPAPSTTLEGPEKP